MIDHSATLSSPERLAALGAYDLDHPVLRQRLDALAARTAGSLEQPIGLVSVVLGSAQLLAGRSGLTGWLAEAVGTPVEWSFCANAVVRDAPYVVSDARVDTDQHDNPLVTIDGITSYAGVPLRTAGGHVIGAHCVIGGEPRTFNAEDLAVLEAAAQEAVDIIEEYRLPAAA